MLNMDKFSEYANKHDVSDNELLAIAMDNTYEYLVSDMERQYLPAGTWMLRRPRRINTLNQLIDYFTETEEYEKCAELVKIKHTIN
tara:strand:+ start:491 stop:748 length:258 start_codon:yes stop_codon:yes gene_type:complete